MRPCAWYAVVRCYGLLDGYHYASHLTIAKESGQLNIQMSPKRTHSEKKWGLCFLGYKGEFYGSVRQEVNDALNKIKKEKKAMTEEANNSQEVETTDTETEKTEPATIQIPNIFQEEIDDIQKMINKMENELCSIDVSTAETTTEIKSTEKMLEDLRNQLKYQSTKKDKIVRVLDGLKLTKEDFEDIK